MDGEDFHKELVRYQSPKYHHEAGYRYHDTCTFFFDNLCYYPGNDGQYNKAGKIIKKRTFQTNTFQQFVPGKDFYDVELTIMNEKDHLLEIVYLTDQVIVYADDIKPFPKYFRKQFEVILLDGESDERGQREENTATAVSGGRKTVEQGRADGNAITIAHGTLTYKDKTEKLEPTPMALLKLLYENKDKLLTRGMIFDSMWGGKDIYERQITDHILAIRNALTRLGVDRGIIDTVKGSKRVKGGYIFHTNFVTLSFH